METKICSKCGEEKPITHYLNGHNQCRRCKALHAKEYRKKNKEKLQVKKKNYYTKNKESHLNYCEVYRKKNKEKIATYKKKYGQKNAARIKVKQQKVHKKRQEQKQNEKHSIVLQNSHKICSCCGENKHYTEFTYKQAQCRSCTKKKRNTDNDTDKEKNKKRCSQYDKNNKEKNKEREKDYYYNKGGQLKRKAYYQKNRTHTTEVNKIWKTQHREQINQQNRKNYNPIKRKKDVIKLADHYIKQCIYKSAGPTANITQKIIEEKRNQILLSRTIININKEISNL